MSLFLATTGMCLVTAAAATAPLNDEDVTRIAKQAIVYLTIEGKHPDSGKIEEPRQGTGFLISRRGHVVTARHLLQVPDGRRLHEAKLIGVLGGGRFTSHQIPLQFVDDDRNHDVALLKLEDPGRDMAPATVCTADPTPGARLVAYGFPYDTELSITPGTFSHDSGPGGHWQVTMNFTHGMSGGPVYDSEGRVRGIVKGGGKGEAVLRWVVPVRAIDPWLRTYDTPAGCSPGVETGAPITPTCRDEFLKPFKMHLDQTKVASDELRSFLDEPNLERDPYYIQNALAQPGNLLWRKRAETLLGHNRDAVALIQQKGACIQHADLERKLSEYRQHAEKFKELWEIILSSNAAPTIRDSPHIRTRFPDGLEELLRQLIEASGRSR